MPKTFWFDCETTGLKAGVHEAHQVAYLIDFNGEILAEGTIWIRPTKWELVEESALAVSGVTVEILKSSKYVLPDSAHRSLVSAMGKYVNKFERSDKFYPAGYNARFDYDFLQELFRQAGDPYFGSWFNHRTVDPLALVRILDYQGLMVHPDGSRLANHQLSTVCAAYGVEIAHAHNAIEDVKATRDLYSKIVENDNGRIYLKPPTR